MFKVAIFGVEKQVLNRRIHISVHFSGANTLIDVEDHGKPWNIYIYMIDVEDLKDCANDGKISGNRPFQCAALFGP